MDSFSKNRSSHNWCFPDNIWWIDRVRHHISVEWEVAGWPLDSMEEWVYVELPYFLCSKHREFACLFLKLFKSQLYGRKQSGTHNSRWGSSAGLQAPGGKQVVWADFQHLQERMGRSSRQVSGDQTQPLLGACAILSAAEGVEKRESHPSTELSVALAWGLGLHHPWETRTQVILWHWFWEEAPKVHVEERQDCKQKQQQ